VPALKRRALDVDVRDDGPATSTPKASPNPHRQCEITTTKKAAVAITP